MQRRISVIIPVYNGARFIREALESVCNQTYLPVEIVVADDCSIDNTCEVVAEFARTTPVPITLFSMQKNTGGPYGPAREAFHRTTGEYLVVLDADDLFDPDAFATYIAMYEADPTANVGLAATDLMMFEDGTGRTVLPSSFARWPSLLESVLADPSPTGVLLTREQAYRAVAFGFAIPFRGLIARAAWEAIGGPDPHYFHTGDCDFTWRLVSKTNYRVRLLNRPLNRVRASPGSMSANRLISSRQLIDLYRDMLLDIDDQEIRADIRRRLRDALFDLAYHSYKKRKFWSVLPAVWGLAVERLRATLSPTRQPYSAVEDKVR